MTNTSPILSLPSYRSTLDVDDIRMRALERLYARREAVDTLISSLEDYQSVKTERAECVPITAGRR